MEKLSLYVSKERRKIPLKREAHKLSVCSEILLREALCAELQVSSRALKFRKTELGKPYLEDFPIKFSLSHTQSAVAVAVAGQEVGVDVEKLRPANLKIAERHFSEDEKAFLFASKNKDADFFMLWTRKEAYLKRIGKGLTLPLSSFSVLKEKEQYRTYFRNGYVISLCCDKDTSVYFSEVSEDELLYPRLAPV